MAQPTGEPQILHENTLDIPLQPAWELLREFGSWGEWCPLFNSMRITNGQKGVGAIRKFHTLVGNLVYEEKLTVLDDKNFTLTFELVSMSPKINGLVSVTNRLTLKDASNAKEKRTYIKREAWNTTQGLSPEILAGLFAKQKASFDKEDEILKIHILAKTYIGEGMGFFNDKLMTLTKAILTGQSPIWEYEEYPDYMGYLPKMVKGLPMSEVLPAHQLGEMITRFIEVVYLQAKQYIIKTISPQQLPDAGDIYSKEALALVQAGFMKPTGLDEVTSYLVNHWDSDVEFCQQLLSGVNPMHIKLVENIEEIPDVLQSLTGYNKVGDKEKTKSVKDLIHEKRLFILDYRVLASLHILPFEPTAYFTAPVMLVYRQLIDDHNSQLNILGIQIHPTKNELFTPDMPQKNRYKLARMFVAVADNQVHEFMYHLGLAHMGMEPFVVSIHNRLPKGHPVRSLLQPHTEGTIGIAYFARQTLIAEKEAFTDRTFPIGTKQGVQLASEAWRGYSFYKSSFPQQLKNRGFDEKKADGLQNFFYREDGFKLWNVIGEYTTDVVNHFYKTDEAVQADGDIQMWADETASKDGAAVPGFPSSITTKAQLSEVLQILVWNFSAQHSVVNFPQTPYLTMIPNRPNSLYKPMPELDDKGTDVSDEYLKEALATGFQMDFQILFSWLLALPTGGTLLQLQSLKDVYPEGDAKFRANLNTLSTELHARNKELVAKGKAPYIFLLPENVACSINI